MKDAMEYKGYLGSVHYSTEDRVFFGKLLGLRSSISFEGSSVDELQSSFEEAVEDYLELCRSKGIEAEKPYKGSFNVRVPSRLHRLAAVVATQKHTTLNQVIVDALDLYLGHLGVTPAFPDAGTVKSASAAKAARRRPPAKRVKVAESTAQPKREREPSRRKRTGSRTV